MGMAREVADEYPGLLESVYELQRSESEGRGSEIADPTAATVIANERKANQLRTAARCVRDVRKRLLEAAAAVRGAKRAVARAKGHVDPRDGLREDLAGSHLLAGEQAELAARQAKRKEQGVG